VGQEVEAAAAEAARVDKRLRADVDHSLQQLAAELTTETELRTKRHTELASDVSQLHSQADELTTAVARTRAMVMEEAIEKLNGVRREVEAVHSEMSMRPTKTELKAALDTVGSATASALTELRQQVWTALLHLFPLWWVQAQSSDGV
jgi:DNA repair exonuclease SbcCD ATPase subunit